MVSDFAPVDQTLSTGSDEQVGQIGRIPVRNIWLLMLYASHLFRDGEFSETSAEANPDDIPDLVAEMLSREVERRLKRNLSFGYQTCVADLNRVRGRIDILDTERRRLLDRGRVACTFEELTIDTARNRYVRAALKVVSRIVKRKDLSRQCQSLAAIMGRIGVADCKPHREEVTKDRVGRHEAGDVRLLWIANLAFDLALPTESLGGNNLTSPERDEVWVRKLYEKAIAGMYDIALQNQGGWTVHPGKSLEWQIDEKTAAIDSILPSMRSDIVVEHRPTERRIVVDTKFNALLTRGWYRDETVRSGYLYQMYAYLRSQVGKDEFADRASGLLLHPCVGEMIDECVSIQGHKIRFATVNLAGSPAAIRSQLLKVLE